MVGTLKKSLERKLEKLITTDSDSGHTEETLSVSGLTWAWCYGQLGAQVVVRSSFELAI